METIRSIPAFYPMFSLGCKPAAVPCSLRIVEANGKRYLKTPFAMLDAFADDDPERQIALGHYYATEADCLAYLNSEYPRWETAQPIMDELESAIRHYGSIVGPARVADAVGVSVFDIHKLAPRP